MSSTPGAGQQPSVRGNDWSVLDVPALGTWEPALTVSVIIPAHDPLHLPKVLAGLAAQSYPDHLLEVVVVDDGSDPPLGLPEVRPVHTRLVSTAAGWGRAAACQHGVDHSDGQVIHWLDADMVPHRHEVEAHLRWHHVVDYAVTLAEKTFAATDALDHLTPSALHALIDSGADPTDLARGETWPHEWVDSILRTTNRLRTAGPRAMRVHVGASATVGRELYQESGGMPVDLVLGEDIVLGYRLREAGAVFIPDAEARCTHLGETTVMRRERVLNRYNRPFIADKVPEFRGHRTAIPRSYEVPYVEVVVPVEDATYEDVRVVVDHLLAGRLPDLVVTLVADWRKLTAERRAVLNDEHLDLRLVAAAYASEHRVRRLSRESDRSDATFRLQLPGAAWVPVGKALDRLVLAVETEQLDVVEVDLPGAASRARLARSSYVARALRSGGQIEIDELYDATDVGFASVAGAPRIRRARGGLTPWGSRARRND